MDNLISRKNWNCDNDRCREPHGEVRTLPYGGSGNLLLCRACYDVEMAFRRLRVTEDGVEQDFPAWETLSIYSKAGKSRNRYPKAKAVA